MSLLDENREGAMGAVEGASDFAALLSVGHQEIDRIVDEVEQIYKSQPLEWLGPLENIGMMIVNVQDWYEDYDEFEDACGGSFESFLSYLPHIETRHNEEGVAQFKVLPPDPDAQPTIYTLHVKDRKDLWRVLFKSPDATVRFPSIEFEIGSDSKRRIDTVYNHITNAVWNLSSHMRGQAGEGQSSEHAAAFAEVVDTLNAMLDVDEPFDIIVDDPTGVSTFKPSEGIEVETI